MPRRRPALPLLFACALLAGVALRAGAAEPSVRKSYDVPAGPAISTLKQFISQSGVQLLYDAQEVSAVKTNAVRGEFTAGAAVNRMLENTGVIAVETENGAITLKRAPDPNASRAAIEADARPMTPSRPISPKNPRRS